MTDVDADPATRRGRPQPLASRETVGIGRPTSDPTQRATGVLTTACLYTEIERNTGSPCGEGACLSTGRPRGTGRAAWGDGEVRSTCETG